MKRAWDRYFNITYILLLTKFIFVGVLNTAVGYGFYYLFAVIFGIYWPIATLLGHTIGVIHSYFWNRYFTFKSSNDNYQEFLKFIFICILQYFLTLSLNALFIQVLNFSIAIGGLTSILIVTVLSFFGHYLISFSSAKSNIESSSKELLNIEELLPDRIIIFSNSYPRLFKFIKYSLIVILSIIGYLLILTIFNFIFTSKISINNLLTRNQFLLSNICASLITSVFNYIYLSIIFLNNKQFVIAKQKKGIIFSLLLWFVNLITLLIYLIILTINNILLLLPILIAINLFNYLVIIKYLKD